MATLPPPTTTTRLPVKSGYAPSPMAPKSSTADITPAASTPGIRSAFPACAPGGVFDRKELGKLVFANQAALQRLTEITNGYVFAKVSFLLDEAARKEYPAAAIDAIGLLESGLTLLCHTTVAITAPQEARLARLLAREPISPAYAQARIDAQRTDEEFSALCRHTLHNDTTQAAFEAACRQLFTELLHERSFHCERE